MDLTHEQKNELFYQDILENGANFTWPQYAERHGLVSTDAATLKWKRYAIKNGLAIKLERKFDTKPPPYPGLELKTTTLDKHGGTITERWGKQNTPTELPDFQNFQLEAATTNPNGGAWLKYRANKDKESFDLLKESLTSQIKLPDFQPAPIDVSGRNLSLEIMITDHHLGKVGFDPETMEFNWTLPQAAEQYNKAIDHILSQVDVSRLAEIVLPVGNDLLNVDNSSNQTRRGTPQMAGDFWHNVFRFGKQLVIASIEKLSLVAPVKVYMVKGNHDEDSVFSLGEVIQAYFENNPNVDVTNHPVKRNYHRFGANMLGMAHGHEFNMAKAMQTMVTDEPLMFGETTFRCFHLGHLHQNKITKVMNISMKEEHFGVDVEICPSMSPTDAWHYQNAYIGNIRRTKAFLRHFSEGLIQEIYYNV